MELFTLFNAGLEKGDAKRLWGGVKRKGQSLIEAMVAISVLTVGFLGIVSLLSRSIFYSRSVSDTMKATYLASEGIEITKNLIDNDVALALAGNGGGWGTCFARYGNPANLEMDYATTDCGNLEMFTGQGDPLLFDPTKDLYGYNFDGSAGSGATQTNFTREIRVKVNGDEVTVNSIVTWSTGSIVNQSVDMEDHFYNWQIRSVNLGV